MGQYKRRIYLINPSFQLKFSFLVCILLFISSLIYPLTIYKTLTTIAGKLGNSSPSLKTNIEEMRQSLLIVLSIWQVGYMGLIFIICIFFSHKIAGPMYKLTKWFRGIRDGQNMGNLSFRHGDYFHDIAEEFNLTFNHMQENYKNDFVYLSEVNTYLSNLSLVVPDDKKVVLNEINKKLTEIQERFNN